MMKPFFRFLILGLLCVVINIYSSSRDINKPVSSSSNSNQSEQKIDPTDAFIYLQSQGIKKRVIFHGLQSLEGDDFGREIQGSVWVDAVFKRDVKDLYSNPYENDREKILQKFVYWWIDLYSQELTFRRGCNRYSLRTSKYLQEKVRKGFRIEEKDMINRGLFVLSLLKDKKMDFERIKGMLKEVECEAKCLYHSILLPEYNTDQIFTPKEQDKLLVFDVKNSEQIDAAFKQFKFPSNVEYEQAFELAFKEITKED